MVTQDQHVEQQRRLKERQRLINEDLKACAVGDMTSDEIYHLGMDMGMRIGEGKV